MLQLYERDCPGFCAILALASYKGQDPNHLSTEIWWENPLVLAPISHPQRYHDVYDLIGISIPKIELEWGVRPLLASILAPRVPQLHLETALSCLRYLQSGGHSVKSRKSLKPLLKSSYFKRLKMQPSLSRFRRRQHHHSTGHYFLDIEDLYSTWWDDCPERPRDCFDPHGMELEGVRVPVCSFSYRSEYASNYDLWYTYRCALRLLPVLLVNLPPDSNLASIATNCIFSSFCTAYPLETRKVKESITRYLSRCRPIRAMPFEEGFMRRFFGK